MTPDLLFLQFRIGAAFYFPARKHKLVAQWERNDFATLSSPHSDSLSD